MNHPSTLLATVCLVVAAPPVASAEVPVRLNTGAVGSVKVGMTVAQASPLLKGLTPGKPVYSDHKGGMFPLMRGKSVALWFLAGKFDTGAAMTPASRFEQIWVHDRAFATSSGVHPGMLVKDAEKKLGPVKRVEASEANGFEVATFTNAPAGMFFAVALKSGGDVGKYAQPVGEYRKATAYQPQAHIDFIGIRPIAATR